MTTPLFSALTRPPERGGIPYDFIIIVVCVPTILFIMTVNSIGFYAVLTVFPLYGLAKYVAMREPYLPRLLRMKMELTPSTRSKSFWRGNSYSPE